MKREHGLRFIWIFLPYAGYAAIAAANYSYATKHCYIAVTRSTERQIAHRQSAQSRPG